MRYILIALATVPLLGGVALAQTATSVSPEFERAKPTDVLSYNLVGLDIVNDQNQTIGEIKDLLLSLNS
ncbi:hypothetical protein [Microvirga terricola]|uniref:PRC-barrel domain-containing protein n=1 Tax=Microvirga terricola TaxID=2719797 RepID=A0ABX0VEH0_9HYPH|nr:hypothetical protein [Microvirga terricola]NIX77345.1 hypothetical protein [Microvirga terricola]